MQDPILSQQSCDYIRTLTPLVPTVGVVLGSGLGAFAEHIENAVSIPYNTIPHFATSTVSGHAGTLILGTLEKIPCCVMSGRIHSYEGHPPSKVVFPIHVMKKLGIQKLVVTNAAGGIRHDLLPGSLMNITDHINLTGQTPLRGSNDPHTGPRFPDMSYAYHPQGQKILQETARSLGITLHNGVYAGLTGPSYETPAEIRMLRTLGADAVGMSTVMEVIASVHMGLQTVGISVISNCAAGIRPEPLDHKEVTAAADQVKPMLVSLLKQFIQRW